MFTMLVAEKKAESTSSTVSTSHLRNNLDTVDTSSSKDKGSIPLHTETGSAASVDSRPRKQLRMQDPFVITDGTVST